MVQDPEMYLLEVMLFGAVSICAGCCIRSLSIATVLEKGVWVSPVHKLLQIS